LTIPIPIWSDRISSLRASRPPAFWWRKNESQARGTDWCIESCIWGTTLAVLWATIGLLDPVVAPLSRWLAANIAELRAAPAAYGIACL
jgi:hypothetical protein